MSWKMLANDIRAVMSGGSDEPSPIIDFSMLASGSSGGGGGGDLPSFLCRFAGGAAAFPDTPDPDFLRGGMLLSPRRCSCVFSLLLLVLCSFHREDSLVNELGSGR
jgi:hypothetical protein